MNKDESDRNDKEAHDIKLWGVFLFGLVGAAVTAFSLSRSQSRGAFKEEAWKRYYKRLLGEYEEDVERVMSRGAFKEEAWKRYYKRLLGEYEEEVERVERIKRMQSVFNRERDKRRRSYESWRGNGGGAHHQHIPRDDWYWKAEESFREQWANYQHTPGESRNYSLSHHYSVLGLDRFRTTPYTEAEIKIAFRTKAMQYHPDQNHDNREASEAKFKEVICSYEAIQKERKNQNL